MGGQVLDYDAKRIHNRGIKIGEARGEARGEKKGVKKDREFILDVLMNDGIITKNQAKELRKLKIPDSYRS